MNLTQLETVKAELKCINYALNKATRAKLQEKLTVRGLTVRNQGLKPKLIKEPRVLMQKKLLRTEGQKN
jgi:hypothetical protein